MNRERKEKHRQQQNYYCLIAYHSNSHCHKYMGFVFQTAAGIERSGRVAARGTENRKKFRFNFYSGI